MAIHIATSMVCIAHAHICEYLPLLVFSSRVFCTFGVRLLQIVSTVLSIVNVACICFTFYFVLVSLTCGGRSVLFGPSEFSADVCVSEAYKYVESVF